MLRNPLITTLLKMRQRTEGKIWTNFARLDRFFTTYDGAVRIQINDAGATPGNVQLRLAQAVEVSER